MRRLELLAVFALLGLIVVAYNKWRDWGDVAPWQKVVGSPPRTVATPPAPTPAPPIPVDGPKVEFVFPSGDDIAVAPYEAPGQPDFAKLFTLVPKWEGMKPALGVMTNRSSLPIVALVTKWSFVGVEGRDRVSVSTMAHAKSPTVRPGETVLLTPLGWIPDPDSVPLAGYSVPDDSEVKDAELAAKIIITVDAVVFSDGRVLGPNSTGELALLEASSRKVQTALRHAQEMLDGGKDVAVVKAYLAGQAESTMAAGLGGELEVLAKASSKKELTDGLREALARKWQPIPDRKVGK
jgi:hypothetical protein